MKIVVGVTDNRWAAFLRDRSDLSEANFWQPSPHGFKALTAGEPFLFKTKDPRKFGSVDIPGYALVGGGFFDEYVEQRTSEAWMLWGPGNGVSSEAELIARVQAYRAGRGLPDDPDPTIGCVVLRNLFFADQGSELGEPPTWSRNIVTTNGYDLNRPDLKPDTDYVQDAFVALQRRARVDLAWEPDLTGVALDWQGPRSGPPVLVRPRMGQGHFKRAVAAAYQSRCAVTRSARSPASKLRISGPSPRAVSTRSPTGYSSGPTCTACMTAATSASILIFVSRYLRNCERTAGTASSSTNAKRPVSPSRRPPTQSPSRTGTPWPGTLR